MSTLAERCFERLKANDPSALPGPLVRSRVTEEDIIALENKLKYHLPQSFREFLQAYVLPENTFLVGEFWAYDWAGGWMTYSKETQDYIYDISDELESTLIQFSLDRLWNITCETEHTLENRIVVDEICYGIAERGYIELGMFSDYFVLLDCKKGNVVYLNHEFYLPEINSNDDFIQIEENFDILFKDFDTLLRCLFLGEICDPSTGEISNTLPE